MVKVTYFVVDLKPEHVPVIREVRKKYLDPDRPPASTRVGVPALAASGWLIEVELVAVAG